MCFPFFCVWRMPFSNAWGEELNYRPETGRRFQSLAMRVGLEGRGMKYYLLRHKRKRVGQEPLCLNCWSNGMKIRTSRSNSKVPFGRGNVLGRQEQGLGLQRGTPRTTWPWETMPLNLDFSQMWEEDTLLQGYHKVSIKGCTQSTNHNNWYIFVV